MYTNVLSNCRDIFFEKSNSMAMQKLAGFSFLIVAAECFVLAPSDKLSRDLGQIRRTSSARKLSLSASEISPTPVPLPWQLVDLPGDPEPFIPLFYRLQSVHVTQ
jgi:hypothetical protein